MELWVDGNRVTDVPAGIDTLGEVVSYVATLLESRFRVIQFVAVNDIEVPDWDADLKTPLPKDAVIRVTSESVAQIVNDSIISCLDYLPRLEDGVRSVAARIQQGREQEAVSVLPALLDGLEWYSEFLGSLAAIKPEAAQEAGAMLDRFRAALDEIVAAWEANDLTLVADLLEFELGAQLEQGLDFVRQLPEAQTAAEASTQ